MAGPIDGANVPVTPPPKPLTIRDEWRRKILDDLGGEGVDPDLTEGQLDAALERALECYNKYRPQLTWFPFDVPAAETTVINFFADPAMKDESGNPFGFVRTVLDVVFSDRNRRILGPRAGFLEGYYLRWGYQGPRLFFQLHSGERSYERMTGSRPDWQWDIASRKLFISCPSRDVRVMVLCSRERRLEEVRYDQETDFRRLSVASAKRILARVLGSRGPIPGPAGDIDTDHEFLRAEAGAEWKEIEDGLKRSITSVPPMRYIG
jgi:hypothetical protein